MFRTKALPIWAALLGAMLVAPSLWGGVSRVGTASLRFDEGGYQINFPGFLKDFHASQEEEVRFFTKPRNPLEQLRNPFSGNLTRVVDLYPLTRKYPFLADASSSEFEIHFENLGWRELQTEPSCMKVFTGESESAVYLVAGWGEGRGYLLVGPNVEDVKLAFEEILSSTRLLDGGCRWK